MRTGAAWLRQAVRAAGAAVIVVAAAACDSPLGPEGFTLSGDWAGSWTYESAGVTVTDMVTVTFAQANDTASGSWVAAGGASGSLTLSPRSSTTGSITISQALLGGQTCTGTTSVSGTASGSRIDITAADLVGSGLCQWATKQRFSLTKR